MSGSVDHEAQPSLPEEGGRSYGRLVAWLVLVGVLAGLSFAGNAIVADDDRSGPQSSLPGEGNAPSDGIVVPSEPGVSQRDDSLYRYTTALDGIVVYGIILAVLLLIARGLVRREAFALHSPGSWPRTLGLVLVVLVATYVIVVAATLAIGPEAQPDQGISDFWDGSRAAQFALNFAVVAVLVPIVEELMFRGLGFSLLSDFGPGTAVVATAFLFGLVHGFVYALPIFVIIGLALGWLRMRTGSVYPAMVMHGMHNAVVLVLAVSLGE